MRDPAYVVDGVFDGKPIRFSSVGCSLFGTYEPTAKRFLVFTRGVQQPINADFCAGSMELRDFGRPEAAAYLASVERILAPDILPPGGGAPSRSDDGALAPALAAIGSLALLAGAAFVWRLREPHSG